MLKRLRNIFKLNEAGVSLVEVVASILLLSIILLSFSSFLPQMGKTNNQNENKQQAVNLAQQELIHWKTTLEGTNYFEEFLRNPLLPYSFLGTDAVIQCNDNQPCTSSPVQFISITTTSQDLKYNVKISLKVQAELVEGPTKAYETTVTIFNDRSENISETYGYVFH